MDEGFALLVVSIVFAAAFVWTVVLPTIGLLWLIGGLL